MEPQEDYEPPHSAESGLSDEEWQPATLLQITSTRALEADNVGDQRPSRGQNKLRKKPQAQRAGSESSDDAQQHYQTPRQHARPLNSHAPQQHTGHPNSHPPQQHAGHPDSTQPPPNQGPAHIIPNIFHYSRCTGRKKAVCVGINYTGSSKPLNGCVNDAHNIRQFLIKHWKFKSQDIMVLTDDSRDPKRLPTKTNMLNAMKWLVKDAKAHDSLFFHYSGHGGRLPDQKGDEVDGYDDVIFPVDYEQKGVGIINDDVLNELLVHPIPDGCRLTALFDSCHSSSVLDLVYLYHSNGLLKNSPVSESYRKSKGSPGDVICFSGCEDNQTSADTVEGGLAVGAMSWAFIQCLNANPKQSYQQLLKNIRTLLRKHFSQRPQLSSSHRINIRKGFIL